MSLKGDPRRWVTLALAAVALGATGCNITRTAARFASPILESGVLAFESETDPAFAEAAAPSNLKLLEGLLLEAPDDRELLTLASRGFATYAFGFLDPQVEAARIEDPSAVPELERRMQEFYSRAFEYGRRALRRGLGEALSGDQAAFEAALARQREADIPQLFWTAYALGALIQLDVTDPDRLAAFPRVNAMMARVIELDETYYFAGAHLFFGVLYAALPPGGGGDTAASLKHLDRAQELTGGDLLIIDVLRARFLAVRLQDFAMYQLALERAISSSADAGPPEARLANEVAQRRARFYQGNADAYFLDVPSDDAQTPMTVPAAGPTAAGPAIHGEEPQP